MSNLKDFATEKSVRLRVLFFFVNVFLFYQEKKKVATIVYWYDWALPRLRAGFDSRWSHFP